MNKPQALRTYAMILLALYALQFLLGMTLNLFVHLPDRHPGTSGDFYFLRAFHSLVWALSGGGGPALLAHAYTALVLFLGSLGLFIASVRLHVKTWNWATGIASFFTLGALFNGLSFVSFNEDFSSMIMATCWLVAVGLLIFCLSRLNLSTSPQRS